MVYIHMDICELTFADDLGFAGEFRWDEKAGLQTGCCTLPSYRRAQGTDKKETGNEEG
jgi:hypothetical protein